MDIKRFGYNGFYHQAAVDKVKGENDTLKKILSICLEPVPEVAAVYNGKPLMVSSGAAPMEGIIGNTSVGEIDPGILILLEEKKKWSAEGINEILTKESGLSAIAGEYLDIDDMYKNEEKFEFAEKVFEYKILLYCGSAIAAMNGVDAVAFSGRYIDSAYKLAEHLIPELIKSSVKGIRPETYFLSESLEEIIVQEYSKIYAG